MEIIQTDVTDCTRLDTNTEESTSQKRPLREPDMRMR